MAIAYFGCIDAGIYDKFLVKAEFTIPHRRDPIIQFDFGAFEANLEIPQGTSASAFELVGSSKRLWGGTLNELTPPLPEKTKSNSTCFGFFGKCSNEAKITDGGSEVQYEAKAQYLFACVNEEKKLFFGTLESDPFMSDPCVPGGGGTSLNQVTRANIDCKFVRVASCFLVVFYAYSSRSALSPSGLRRPEVQKICLRFFSEFVQCIYACMHA